jgi:hypothetical protein
MPDFTRLCDHTEAMLALRSETVWKLIETFRSLCLGEYSKRDEVDPALTEMREALGPFNPLRWLMAPEGYTFLPRQITHLMSNPRVLKTSLRRTWEGWKALHGEIDFDDLLVCNVLRESQPRAFDFIFENIGRLRNLPEIGRRNPSARSPQDNPENDRQSLEAMWLRIVGDSAEAFAARTILYFLFPAWSSNFSPRRNPPPQGLAAPYGDYWARLNSEAIDASPSDQAVLRSIRAWKQTKLGDLGKNLLRDKGFSDKFENFASRRLSSTVDLEADEIRCLASELFSLILNEFGAAAHADSAPGNLSLWRSLIQKQAGNHGIWLQIEAKKALAVSVSFTADLLYYWGSPTLFGNAQNELEQVYHGVLRIAQEMWATNTDVLISALSISQPYSLSRLTRQRDDLFATSETWQALAPILLDAGEKSPELVVPQLAYIISKTSVAWDDRARASGAPREMHESHELSSEQLNALFPSKPTQMRMLRILTANLDLSRYDQATRERIEAIRTEAATLLASATNTE